MINVTCGLTAKKPGSAPCPTLVIEYGTTLLIQLSPDTSKGQNSKYHRSVLAAGGESIHTRTRNHPRGTKRAEGEGDGSLSQWGTGKEPLQSRT